jgi:2-iminobutanoate/2-iminopropanoate deaminase
MTHDKAASMRIEEIKSPKLSEPLGIYSHGIKVVEPKSLVFLSGLTSRDADGKVVGKGDIKLQTRTVLENMRSALAETGASMDDIVQMTLYIKDMTEFDQIHEVRAEFFNKPYPACAMLEVSRMVNTDSLIEIEAVAAVGN